MELTVLNHKGNKTKRTVALNDAIFGVEPNDHAIYLDVKLKLANKRQGTHKSKERAEITGSTRKIKRQKGTGTARAGSLKSPVFVGGGRAFGPRPRNYGFKLNKKLVRLAKLSALSYKAKDENILVLEDIKMDAPKTKAYVEILNGLKVDNARTLLLVAEHDSNVVKSVNNIPNAEVLCASDINTYDVMRAHKLIICEGAIEKLENLFN